MSTVTDTMAAAKHYCDADFTYVDAPGGGTTMPVLDGRSVDADLRWPECGFERVNHTSALSGQPRAWHDEERVNTEHAAEIADLARELSGASHAVVYPTIIRSPESAKKTPDYAPIRLVHSDYTEDYRPMVTDPSRPYRQFLEPLLAQSGLVLDDLRSAARLLMLQFWRNTGPVEADMPLAFCDTRGIDPDRIMRFVVPEYGGQKLAFEACGFRAPQAGQDDPWYTFPNLHDDEAVALRTYDSECADAGAPFWTPHSAFRDPHVTDSPDHARTSIEMRALCIWTQ